MEIIRQEMERLLKNLIFWRNVFTRELAKSPPGGLILVKQGRKRWYMRSVRDGTGPSGRARYVKSVVKEDSGMLKSLALKEYYRVALKILDHNIHCMERAKAGLIPMDFEAIRVGMRKTYQGLSNELFYEAFLAQPISLPQQRWAREPYEQSDFKPKERKHTTSRGLKVRSRAEVLIVEMLYRYGVPFRYEQVICIGKYRMAPDFTFLDSEGNEFYWEYCGMMSDPYYVDRQLWRRSVYESVGINEWTNMIYTYDDKDSVDMREIEAIIRTKILPRIRPEGEA